MRYLQATVVAMCCVLPVYAQEVSPLTSEEKLRIEVLNLKVQLAQTQKALRDLTATYGQCAAVLDQAAIDQAVKQLTSEIEAARPGFTFNPKSGEILPTLGKEK